MKEAPAPAASSEVPAPPPGLSPGMSALLRGGNGVTGAEGAVPPATAQAPVRGSGRSASLAPELLAQPAGKRLVQASLVLADLLLMASAVCLAFNGTGRFGLWEAAFCVVALAAGAWLSFLAVWME